jgi:hypothetical protein
MEKKTIENMKKERSSSTNFSDLKCGASQPKYPNLITSRSILFFVYSIWHRKWVHIMKNSTENGQFSSIFH